VVTKYFECEHCGTRGKIIIKDENTRLEDLVCCPVCAADIYEEEDFADDE
jgi:hypothetical protein